METPGQSAETPRELLEHLIADVHDLRKAVAGLEAVVSELAPHARKLVARGGRARGVLDYLGNGTGSRGR